MSNHMSTYSILQRVNDALKNSFHGSYLASGLGNVFVADFLETGSAEQLELAYEAFFTLYATLWLATTFGRLMSYLVRRIREKRNSAPE